LASPVVSPGSFIAPFKRPWLVISMALHGLLLFVPFIPRSPVATPATKPVKLTRLPPSPRPPVPKLTPLPTPKLSPSVPPSPVVKPLAPLPSPIVVLTPVPAPVPSPKVSPSPSPIASPSPVASPSPSPIASPSPSPEDPFADFPHVPGAQAGCAGSERCWQTPDTQWRSLAVNIQQDLTTQGYTLESVPLAEETGRQMYKVSKAGETPYYLSFVSTPQGTIYAFTEQPMTSGQMDILSGFSQ
jgi:hypothetical protein